MGYSSGEFQGSVAPLVKLAQKPASQPSLNTSEMGRESSQTPEAAPELLPSRSDGSNSSYLLAFQASLCDAKRSGQLTQR
jgi:hypothetical protein